MHVTIWTELQAAAASFAGIYMGKVVPERFTIYGKGWERECVTQIISSSVFVPNITGVRVASMDSADEASKLDTSSRS